jgi:hypothetical protein
MIYLKAILYFLTVISTILSIRMLSLEILSGINPHKDYGLQDYFHFMFYIPTGILWAICLII